MLQRVVNTSFLSLLHKTPLHRCCSFYMPFDQLMGIGSFHDFDHYEYLDIHVRDSMSVLGAELPDYKVTLCLGI